MYQSVYNSRKFTESDIKEKFFKKTLRIAKIVLDNSLFGVRKPINRVDFIISYNLLNVKNLTNLKCRIAQLKKLEQLKSPEEFIPTIVNTTINNNQTDITRTVEDTWETIEW